MEKKARKASKGRTTKSQEVYKERNKEIMRANFLIRQTLSKELTKVMPYVFYQDAKYIGFGGVDYDFEQIPLIREIIEYTKANGYKARLELYQDHKILDVVIENEEATNPYQSNFVISYSLITKKIVGGTNNDMREDPFFTSFIYGLVEKYLEPIGEEIGIDEVLNEIK